jgi:DNA-binding Xre family transcriptional regulator
VVTIERRLRMLAAERGVWGATQLRDLLYVRARHPMSVASVAELLRATPKLVKVATLEALCVALRCQPGDLLVAIVEDERPGQ